MSLSITAPLARQNYFYTSWTCRCNLPNVELNVSQTVRWYLVGLGGQAGLHTPIFENGLLLNRGSVVLTEDIAPTVTVAVDMTANVAGEWLYWDDVLEHAEGGMEAKYVVTDPNIVVT